MLLAHWQHGCYIKKCKAKARRQRIVRRCCKMSQRLCLKCNAQSQKVLERHGVWGRRCWGHISQPTGSWNCITKLKVLAGHRCWAASCNSGPKLASLLSLPGTNFHPQWKRHFRMSLLLLPFLGHGADSDGRSGLKDSREQMAEMFHSKYPFWK